MSSHLPLLFRRKCFDLNAYVKPCRFYFVTVTIKTEKEDDHVQSSNTSTKDSKVISNDNDNSNSSDIDSKIQENIKPDPDVKRKASSPHE